MCVEDPFLQIRSHIRNGKFHSVSPREIYLISNIITLVVFIPNFTATHAITCANSTLNFETWENQRNCKDGTYMVALLHIDG